MYVWSKRIVLGLGAAFLLIEAIFLLTHTSFNIGAWRALSDFLLLNYVLLMVWLFVWMYDQARVRGKNVWLWLAPFILAPLPTLIIYVLYLQRRIK